MTTLEGVKEILSRAGLRPVSSLDTDGSSWASQAEALLDRESLSVLTQGWHFNHKVDVTWDIDANGYITIPDTVIWFDSYGVDASTDVAPSPNGRLFDRTNNTDVFASGVRVEFIERWDFHCIPHPVQEYIVARAAVEFIKEAQGSNRLLADAEANRRDKNGKANQYEVDMSNTNIVQSGDLTRVRGYRTHYYRSV